MSEQQKIEYNDDDKIVLEYFFTNLDKPIFGAKNFHPEVWALMQARYSRSTEGMRQGFLKLLKEDESNYKELVSFLKLNKSGSKMDHAINKAIQFMDKWVLGYGHSSVAEGATVGFALEGVSILATKVIEDNRLASYIEKSTRYVSFGNDSFYIPEKLKNSKYGQEVTDYIDLLFKTYMDLHEPVLKHVKSMVPLKPGDNEKAWERSCAARRFDSIRYLLPACTITSLGWTLNARQLAHAITKLKSHQLEEMHQIGDMLKEEGKKVLPSLLKYADENKFMVDTETAMQPHVINKPDGLHATKSVELVESAENADDILISSILYRYSNCSYKIAKLESQKMTKLKKQGLLDDFIAKRGQFDPIHREFEHVYVTFDILMDYGAFRDIQRHRMCTQTNQLLTTSLGFDTPEDILSGEKNVLDKYNLIMKKAADLYTKISSEDKYLAQYVVPLAYRKRVLMTLNLRQAFYFIKLRSTPQGHISYRKIAKEMFDLLVERYPMVSKYFTCDLANDELGRMQQETKFEEKISKLK